MSQFDPAMAEVTEVFYEIGEGTSGKKLYTRAGFRYVQYDDDPDRYIEPVSVSHPFDLIGVPGNAKPARVVGAEYVRGRVGDVHLFGDLAFEIPT